MPTSRTYRRAVLTLLVLAAGGAVAVACGGDDSMGPDPDPTVASVDVTPSSASLSAIGATASFQATARDSAGSAVSGASVSWSSSDQAVATVDGSGTVTAAGNGEATITASAGGAEGTATVTVDQEVSQLGLEPGEVSLVAGDTAQFEASPADANGNAVAGVTVAWSSTDSSVVSVDSTGRAVAGAEGEASVVAAAGGVEETASVTVRAEAQSVTVAPDSAELTALGATEQFEATALDADGDTISGVGFDWSSSDSAVATVDGSGLATSEGSGTATITAELDGASGTATLVVDQQASSVTVSPDTASVGVDDTTRFEAEASDANGNALPDPDFAWSSTDTDVATVDSTGLVTGESDGSAMVVAETGGVADSVVVNVTRTVASVTVTPDSAGVTTLGDSVDYAAAALDAADDTIPGVSFSWSSSDTTVATVDDDGTAVAQGNGTASITAETAGVSGSGTFTVDAETSSSVSAVSGGGQEDGVTTRTFGEALVVEVTDGSGSPQSGTTVTWTVTAGDATFADDTTETTATTGSDGRASVDVTAGESTGPVTVEASVEGADGSPVTFDLETTTALFLVGDIYFEDPAGNQNTQASVEITLGHDVTWEWVGNLQHNVVSGAGSSGSSGDGVPEGGSSINSGDSQSSGTFSFTPGVAGTWEFYCEIHPTQMYGSTIVVEEGSSSDAAAGLAADGRQLEPGDTIRPEGSHFVFIYRGPPGSQE